MSANDTTKKHIISLAGKPGSGKSTTANLLAEKLGYARHSTGDMFRELSKERGMDLLTGNQHAVNDRTIDDIIDLRQKEMGEAEDEFVIDGRLAWHFIPNSFKVYLDLDSLTAANRIIENMSHERISNENVHADPVEYAKDLDERLAIESGRYANLYGVNMDSLDNYNFIINTADHSQPEVIDMIIDEFNRWLELN